MESLRTMYSKKKSRMCQRLREDSGEIGTSPAFETVNAMVAEPFRKLRMHRRVRYIWKCAPRFLRRAYAVARLKRAVIAARMSMLWRISSIAVHCGVMCPCEFAPSLLLLCETSPWCKTCWHGNGALCTVWQASERRPRPSSTEVPTTNFNQKGLKYQSKYCRPSH